jgi:hypothetical protein
MSRRTTALITAASLTVSLSPAVAADAYGPEHEVAADVYELSPVEMDQVTAGVTSTFTRTFILPQLFAPTQDAGTVTLDTPNGKLTGTFDVSFISFMGGGTHIEFNKFIQTIAIFH